MVPWAFLREDRHDLPIIRIIRIIRGCLHPDDTVTYIIRGVLLPEDTATIEVTTAIVVAVKVEVYLEDRHTQAKEVVAAIIQRMTTLLALAPILGRVLRHPVPLLRKVLATLSTITNPKRKRSSNKTSNSTRTMIPRKKMERMERTTV